MDTLSAVVKGTGRVLGWFIDRPKRLVGLLVILAILSPSMTIHLATWSLGRILEAITPFLGLAFIGWIVWTFFLKKPSKGKKK